MVKRDKCNKVFYKLITADFYHPVTTATNYNYLTWIRVPGCVVLFLFFLSFFFYSAKAQQVVNIVRPRLFISLAAHPVE